MHQPLKRPGHVRIQPSVTVALLQVPGGSRDRQRQHEEDMAELERLRWVSALGRQQHIMARAWQIKQEALVSFYQATLDSLAAGKACT